MKKKISINLIVAIHKILLFLIILFETLAFLFLLNKLQEHFKLLLFVMLTLNTVTILNIFAIQRLLGSVFKKNVMLVKNDFMSVLGQINSLTKIVKDLFNGAKDIALHFYTNEKEIKEKTTFTDEVNTFINDVNEKISNMNTYYFKGDKIDINRFTEDIIKLEIMTVKIKEFIHENIQVYKNEIIKMKLEFNSITNNTVKFLYRLKIASPILNELSISSNDYSIKIVKSIFDKFDNISDYSQGIYKNTQETITDFMNENDKNSLGYLLKDFKNIKVKVDNFYSTMSELKVISDNFLTNSIESLKKIGSTSSMIEDIAEKIKIIAINVRIEASRISTETGFKVLGKEITEFANITSKSAKESFQLIKDTTGSIELLKNDYTTRLNEVYEYLGQIKNSFFSFEGIINNSFNKIKSVVKFLDDFSNNINTRIKETVGMLQFHDLTTQESSHIISGIDYITKTFFSFTQNMDIENTITKEEQKELIKQTIETFNGFITTDNERKIIEKNALSLGIILNDHSHILKNTRKIDDQTTLF